MQDKQNNTPQSAPRRRGPQAKMAPPQKADNFWVAIKKLFLYTKTYGIVIIFAMLLALAASILNLVGPGKLSELTDLITAGLTTSVDVEAVMRLGIFLVTIYAVAWFLNFATGFIMATVTQKITRKLRSDISNKIDRLPLSYFDSTSTGNIMSRITNDVDLISQTLNQGLSTLITATTMSIGSQVLMFDTNWVMATAATIAAILGFVFMMVILLRSQKYFIAQQQTLGELNGIVEETYSGHTVVKAYNAEAQVKQDFKKTNDKLFECAWKSQFFSGLMQPLMSFIGNLGYVVVCITGAILVINNEITFGVIIAFMVYVRQFTSPLAQFAQVGNSLQSAAAAAERVFEILEADELVPDSKDCKQLESIKGNVEFKHVKFGYDEDKTIIQDFSAVAKPGQKIAIVGPTGAGKTTLVNLLMRFYEIQGGNISIDGIDTKNLTRETVHDQFCMVLQDTWLFEGTIRENIVYSKKDVSDEAVIEACKAVGMHHFIQTLPEGYDTVLGDSTSLSQGQRQLLTIARAMVKNAPMLILDEATSSVDTRTEELIQKSMDRLMVGRTSFVIAHRLSTIKNADLILVLNQGEIVEQGTHAQLLALGGAYAELYNSQFED